MDEAASVNDATRLKYRYLELRTPRLQEILMLRSKVCHSARNYMDENGFIEIETPFLCRSTPEGARDYLVPSRVHKGEFYALPQSPQLYKQIMLLIVENAHAYNHSAALLPQLHPAVLLNIPRP